MVGLKSGPRLVIDHMLTYQLVSMPEFWNVIPLMLDEFRAEAEIALTKVKQIAMGKKCAGCTSIRTIMTPTHNQIWRRLAKNTVMCDDVAAFIASKRGFLPRPITVYYVGDDGKTAELNF